MTEKDFETVELDTPLRNVKRIYVGGSVAFVPHPYINGAWMKTHPDIAVACSHCSALPGELCVSTSGKRTGTIHYRRARSAGS